MRFLKKYLLSSLLLGTALPLAFISCNKDAEAGKNNTDLILGTWILAQSGVDANGNNVMEPAERDSSLKGYLLKQTYAAGGTGEKEVTVSNQPFSKTAFNWSLIENESILRIIQNDTREVVILTLTETDFTYYAKESSPHQITVLTR